MLNLTSKLVRWTAAGLLAVAVPAIAVAKPVSKAVTATHKSPVTLSTPAAPKHVAVKPAAAKITKKAVTTAKKSTIKHSTKKAATKSAKKNTKKTTTKSKGKSAHKSTKKTASATKSKKSAK